MKSVAILFLTGFVTSAAGAQSRIEPFSMPQEDSTKANPIVGVTPANPFVANDSLRKTQVRAGRIEINGVAYFMPNSYRTGEDAMVVRPADGVKFSMPNKLPGTIWSPEMPAITPLPAPKKP